jgi:hypothetical protein
MEDGDIFETLVPEFRSNETPVGPSQSRIRPIMLAVELEGIASEETAGSTNDDCSSEVVQLCIVSLDSSFVAREFESLSIFRLL